MYTTGIILKHFKQKRFQFNFQYKFVKLLLNLSLILSKISYYNLQYTNYCTCVQYKMLQNN